jgi:hypothetical protein
MPSLVERGAMVWKYIKNKHVDIYSSYIYIYILTHARYAVGHKWLNAFCNHITDLHSGGFLTAMFSQMRKTRATLLWIGQRPFYFVRCLFQGKFWRRSVSWILGQSHLRFSDLQTELIQSALDSREMYNTDRAHMHFECLYLADHSVRALWGMKCLRPLKHWDRGFESHSKHGCLSTFLLCLYCPV